MTEQIERLVSVMHQTIDAEDDPFGWVGYLDVDPKTGDAMLGVDGAVNLTRLAKAVIEAWDG